MTNMDYYYLDKNRVICHIDVDYFEVQIYLKDFPELRDSPCITTQKIRGNEPNPRIVSVNTIAKGFGITREDRLRDAINKCSHIEVFEGDFRYNKPWDGKKVKESDNLLDVIRNFAIKYNRSLENAIIIERTSIDGFYLDITELCFQSNQSFDSQYLYDMKVKVMSRNGFFWLDNINGMDRSPLTYGAVFIHKLREEIVRKTKLDTSVGISYNKLLAKIGGELNKPNTTTIIRSKSGIINIFNGLAINEISGFKKGLGEEVMRTLNVFNVIELRDYSQEYLIEIFGSQEIGIKIWNIARGIDSKQVAKKYMNKSVGTAKNYRKGISLRNNPKDFELECMSLVDKLKYDLKRNQRFANQIRIEFYLSPNCKNDNKVSAIVDIELNHNSNYSFNYIYHNIRKETFNILRTKTFYYKSHFVANIFSQLKPPAEARCYLISSVRFGTSTRRSSALPETADYSGANSEPEERLHEFMTRNRSDLYVNSKSDFESDF